LLIRCFTSCECLFNPTDPSLIRSGPHSTYAAMNSNNIPSSYAHLTRELLSLASGHLVLVLEGGYDLQSISSSCVACAHEMAHAQPNPTSHPTSPDSPTDSLWSPSHSSPNTPRALFSPRSSNGSIPLQPNPVHSSVDGTSASLSESLSLPQPALNCVDDMTSRSLIEASPTPMSPTRELGNRALSCESVESHDSSTSGDRQRRRGRGRKSSSKSKAGSRNKGRVSRRRASTDWEVADALADIRPQAKHAILATRRALATFWPVLAPTTPMLTPQMSPSHAP
jgi:hypothetical protein